MLAQTLYCSHSLHGLTLLSLRSVANIIHPTTRTFLFDHLHVHFRFCNDTVIARIKTIANTVQEVLKILEIGDDGNYQWVPRHLLPALLQHLLDQTNREESKNVDALFFKYVAVNLLSDNTVTIHVTPQAMPVAPPPAPPEEST